VLASNSDRRRVALVAQPPADTSLQQVALPVVGALLEQPLNEFAQQMLQS
jgi:hypothetical protein